MTNEISFRSKYLNDYLAMVEDTESPRIFHIWSAIFAISAALGRRCYLPSGTFNVYPNHYVLLVGTPGTRKTTAASLSKRILKASSGVRFAPSDTGFQRQGFILALQGGGNQDKEFLNGHELKEDSISSLMELEQITNSPEEAEAQVIAEADKHHIAVVASEFSRVIGQNNLAMMDFLGERYDGEDYEYQTKGTHIKLESTLMNMIACTTPVSIANSLPPAAGGQGFLSRIILVYGARKYKFVPRPKAPSSELVERVKDVVKRVYYELNGQFTETKSAMEHYVELYRYPIDIADSRFGYYSERRATHLVKLAMCLAAARGSIEIDKPDYEEAHRILRATEHGMPDALGEFGMNPLAMLKQEILEQLRATQGPMTLEQIVSLFHRDARTHEISEVINDLLKTNLVKQTQAKSGTRYLSAVFTKANTEDAMMQLLIERK